MGTKYKAKNTANITLREISACRGILKTSVVHFNHPLRNYLRYIFHKDKKKMKAI